MKTIYAFDFDGTLTTRDTLIEFIRYARGNSALIMVIIRHLPMLIMMKLRIYPNDKAKQHIFDHFFKGMTVDEFTTICTEFARNSQQLLRPHGIETVKRAIRQECPVVIVSASIDLWVAPFFSDMGATIHNNGQTDSDNNTEAPIIILGTKPEITGGRLTGRFATPNCYGKEKVNRLLALYPHREKYRLIAFGDSRGDKELLTAADESHYKPFRE